MQKVQILRAAQNPHILQTRKNCGQYHHRAVLSDREVELMRQLREDDPKRWTYAELGRVFEVHRMAARSICLGRTR